MSKSRNTSTISPQEPLLSGRGSSLNADADAEAYRAGTLDDTFSPESLVNDGATRKPYMPVRGSQMDFRLRYYDSIATNSRGDVQFNKLQSHLVPPEFYQLQLVGQAQEGSKTSSVMTIFSVWNTMMGSGLLALPWGFSEAGIAGGFAIVAAVGLLSWYTCFLVIKYGIKYDEFFDMCRDYFGWIGEKSAWVASVFVFFSAMCAYDILMTDSLFENVRAFRQIAAGATGPLPDVWWSSNYAIAGLIFIVVFPLTNLKGFHILVKLNSVGIVCVLYIMGFIIVQSTAIEGIKLPVPPLQPKFYFLGGVMMLSFFIHSAIISIMKNNKNQEKNVRDLGIAYILVAASYLSVGACGYMAYHRRGSIPQDFLQIFESTNIPAIIARFALLFQLISVYPLLGMIIRIQVFGVLWKNTYPSWIHVLLLNIFLTVVSTLMAMFYPNVGTVLRFTGPVVGLLLVLLIPIGVKMKEVYKTEGYCPFWITSFHTFLVLLGMSLLVSQFL